VNLAGREVLIWGFGRHGGGLAAARFAAAEGARVRILDRQPAAALGSDGEQAELAGWPWALGGAEHPWFATAEIIIPSPAIPPRAWPAQHPPVISPEALALVHHHGPRVAVTGTKGKSTTARILGELLGWTVAGNSNEPLLAAVARCGSAAPLVIELSSFQLQYLQPHAPRFDAALITNLAQDHLDWHGDIAAYHAAKIALLEWAPLLALGPGCPARATVSAVTITAETYVDATGAVIARRQDLGLLGQHNAENAALALSLAIALAVPRAELPTRLRQVRPLPHRLQTVHQGQWTWIDDSIATTPESALAGIAAVKGPLLVILGGADKGADWTLLAAGVTARGAQVLTIGYTGPALAAAIGAAGGAVTACDDLATAVQRIDLAPGGTVLLSPACSSLDQFTSFEARGDTFAALARGRDGLRPQAHA